MDVKIRRRFNRLKVIRLVIVTDYFPYLTAAVAKLKSDLDLKNTRF